MENQKIIKALFILWEKEHNPTEYCKDLIHYHASNELCSEKCPGKNGDDRHKFINEIIKKLIDESHYPSDCNEGETIGGIKHRHLWNSQNLCEYPGCAAIKYSEE